MRIAYVEDNPTNLALVERICGMNHHTVVSYSEGEVAIQQLVREKFDLILMDVELAGEIGGLQVVRHLRRVGLKTPIVAVTAYAMMGDRERCLEAGCDDYLPKPLPINELLLLLAKYEAVVNAPAQPIPEPLIAAPVLAPTPTAPAGTQPEPVPAVPAALVEPRPAPAVPAAGGSVSSVPAAPVPPVAVPVAAPVPAAPVGAKPEPAALPISAGSVESKESPALTEPVSAPVSAPLPAVEAQPIETPPAVPAKVNKANTVETAAEPSKPDEITSLHPS